MYSRLHSLSHFPIVRCMLDLAFVCERERVRESTSTTARFTTSRIMLRSLLSSTALPLPPSAVLFSPRFYDPIREFQRGQFFCPRPLISQRVEVEVGPRGSHFFQATVAFPLSSRPKTQGTRSSVQHQSASITSENVRGMGRWHGMHSLLLHTRSSPFKTSKIACAPTSTTFSPPLPCTQCRPSSILRLPWKKLWMFCQQGSPRTSSHLHYAKHPDFFPRQP